MPIDNSTEEENLQDSPGETTPQTVVEPEKVDDKDGDEDPKIVRYKEQLHGRELQAQAAQEIALKAEAKAIKFATERVEQDNDYLVWLYDEDPEFADKVAQNFWVKDAKAAIAKIEAARNGNIVRSEPALNPEKLYEEWEKRWEAKQTEKQIAATVDDAFSKLSKDEKELAKSKFDSLRGWKAINQNEALELVELALYAVNKTKRSDDKDKAIANLSSTTLGSTTSDRPTASKKSVAGSKELAESMWLWHLYK